MSDEKPTHVVIDLGDGRGYVQRTGIQSATENSLDLREEVILHLHGQVKAAEGELSRLRYENDFLRREYEEVIRESGVVRCGTDAECIGCGCRSLSASECVAEVLAERDSLKRKLTELEEQLRVQ